jgi:NAD(P)H-binding
MRRHNRVSISPNATSCHPPRNDFLAVMSLMLSSIRLRPSKICWTTTGIAYSIILCWLTLILSLALCNVSLALSTASEAGLLPLPKKVAVIGTTGRLGRQAILQLSRQGIAARCLLRQSPSSLPSPPPKSLAQATSSSQVAAYLQTLPGVELIVGDVTDPASLATLLDGTTACLALYGATAPKPFVKSLLLPQIFYPEDVDQNHPKQVNYVGVQNILRAMQQSATCKHLVRITGKGEDPWSIFSILINALGGIAKGWNYEAEQWIRTTCQTADSNLSYTIIRPGIMKEAVDGTTTEAPLCVLDNGGDLPVSAVSYAQIANLAIAVTRRPNCRRATITAMSSPPASTNDDNDTTAVRRTRSYTLDEVQPDTRSFPTSLIKQHKQAARVGGLAILGLLTLMIATAVSVTRGLVALVLARL